ncbi:hypothetical protein ACJX0J_008777, partial [Zea mays]
PAGAVQSIEINTKLKGIQDYLLLNRKRIARMVLNLFYVSKNNFHNRKWLAIDQILDIENGINGKMNLSQASKTGTAFLNCHFACLNT